MVFRHVVMFKLQPDTTAAQREAILNGLARLPEAIPEIRAFNFGTDAGLAEGNFDVAVVAEFDDVDAYKKYAAHPVHVEFVTTMVRPHLAQRSAVQFGS
jgi:hypothetical protein